MMNEKERREQLDRDPRGPFWLRFHVWYWTLTVLYWFVALANDDTSHRLFWVPSNEGGGTMLGNFVGLFVPIGPNNAIFFYLHPGGWAAFVLVAFVLWRGNRFLQRFNPKTWEKVYYNLFTLLALTFITDYLTLFSWASIGVLFSSFAR